MSERSQTDLQAGFRAGAQHAPFNNLSESELWQTLDYIRTFSFDMTLPKTDGILTGQVINGTTNQPVGNLEVTLHGFQNNTEVISQTIQADAQGQFRFENLSTEHSILYLVESTYEDVVYVTNQPGTFTPGTNEANLDLSVYEPTTDDQAIKITQLHYLLSFMPQAVNAVQIFVIGNDGNRAYVGQNGQTFAVPVPSDATAVRFENDPAGTRFVKTDAGYADTEPIVPGPEGSSIIVSYEIPYDSDSLQIGLPLPADTAALNVLMSNQGAKLSSPQLQFVENRQVQGSEFAIFNGGQMAKGDTLTLQLTGLDNLQFSADSTMPGATVAAPLVDQSLWRWIIVALGGLAIVGVAVGYPLLRPQLTHQADLFDADPELHRQKLLLMLARLDEAFEAGQLDEQVYRQARARYKAELVELME